MQIMRVIFLLCASTVHAIDFDQSMLSLQHKETIEKNMNKQLLDYFRTLYSKNDPEYQADKGVKIPKIIHQIWLGAQMPHEYIPYRESWINNHPDWAFVFWADSPANFDQGSAVITSFDALNAWLKTLSEHDRFCVVDVRALTFDNRAFYDGARNYGEKSDILKWEIVYRVGGVYVDTDFECLRPLDFFNSAYDFYTGIQPLDTNHVQLGAALYGAVPGHPILKRCVEEIKNNQHIPQIIAKTGPIHFTRCFLIEADKNGNRDIALPAGYFYPCGYEQKGMQRSVWERPESYAVHHWAGSWLKPEGFERK